MAALTATDLALRLPLGNRVVKSFRATSGATANAADEYITTGLRKIDAVLGLVVIGTTAAPVAATGTVTFTATDPTDEDTITVDGVIYHIQAGTLVDYDVALSNTEATLAANFAHAINRDSAQGNSVYSANTAKHPTVSASVSTAVVTLTARVPGVGGNSITLAKSSTGCTVSGATLTGGADAVVTGNFIKNALGTGQTADSTMGALGIEFGAPSVLFEVTVLGLP